MSAPTGSIATYNQVGLREDLQDVIYDISPMDTYFFSKAARLTAKSTLHEWQTDALAAAVATNAFVEGDDFSAPARAATTRLKNYTQISRKDFVVTGTARRVDVAGRREELAYQTVKAGKELKRDIESAALQNKAATAGSSVSARVSASVETWIYTTNDVSGTGATANTTPAPVSGVAATAGTDGTAAALTEAVLKSALQQSWSQGGDVGVILVGPGIKGTIDAFTGVATRFRNVESKSQAQIIGAADVYVSSFGSHQIVLSRYMRTTVVLCMDMQYWGLAWQRSIKMEEIAKSGDSDKRMLVGEWTVVAKNPRASTKVTGAT